MRVAVVHYDSGQSKRLEDVVKGLARGIGSQGFDVKIVDARLDAGTTLTGYDYIAVGSIAPSPFAGAVPPQLGAFLKSAGMISGKRCYAFIAKGGLRKGKVLGSLMKTMESEGMYLKRSDVLANGDEASAIGARLHIGKSRG